MSVFVFKIEKAFDLFNLPKDDENVIETREFVQFGNEGCGRDQEAYQSACFDGVDV